MQRIAELMVEAGVPAGVFQIVHGAVDVVNRMCDHPNISAVSFVGSSKVANIVSSRCHSHNKRVIALGGAKNHLIALPDCDPAMAARDIVASYAGCCGQRCMAASVLVLVDEDGETATNDILLQQIVEVASKLEAGQKGGQVGPLIDNIAKTRVLQYIKESEEGGAQILLDGRGWASTAKGFWVGPTIILHNNKADRALHEEIFGPVLSVIRVSSREEAIAIENSNPYGNAACIYTEKGANAEWFTKRFRAGMLGVNIGIPVPRGIQTILFYSIFKMMEY
jgi:malonate-semialdehyde dehydrogenase (acetylating) / methylmalonate-semialdehyde dehydrogenase